MSKPEDVLACTTWPLACMSARVGVYDSGNAASRTANQVAGGW